MKKIFKKGTVVLLISSLSFLLIVFLLADYQLNSNYLGQNEIEVIAIADEAESALFYIDQMIKLSIAETWGNTYGRINSTLDAEKGYMFADRCRTLTDFGACKSDFEIEFRNSVLLRNIARFNELYSQDFKTGDFDIEIKSYGSNDNLEGLEIIGTTDKKIEIDKDGIIYKIAPKFHIQRFTIDEMDLLTGKAEHIKSLRLEKQSLEFFDKLSKAMKDCVSVKENIYPCRCDGSDIPIQEKSEEYTMKINQIAEKEYKLQLWKEETSTIEKEETIKGKLLGLYINENVRTIFDEPIDYIVTFDEPYYLMHYPEHNLNAFGSYFIPASKRGSNPHELCSVVERPTYNP
ncbi:MAG: hypothetical protein KKA79_02750 [Nanoarchaeota archaeon]|nr:hypothetical protein [Nanoarchaeota archaeon]MCG2718643.1 hypothetical protein [Nanoarchaeota archaeon]